MSYAELPRVPMRLLVPLALCLWLALPASAVVLDTDAPGNTGPPANDPGWAHAGITLFNAVYLGNGWVVAAEHTVDTEGIQEVRFPAYAHCRYQPIAGSKVTLQNPPEGPSGTPDLALWRIDPNDAHRQDCEVLDLPVLPLRSEPLALGEVLTLIGAGADQLPFGTVCLPPPTSGYAFVSPRVHRWGTNEVFDTDLNLAVGGLRSRVFATSFDSGVSPDEAQAANGDSGGGVFAMNSQGEWELAGIFTAAQTQCPGAAVYGDLTYAVEIAHYRDQIHDLARDCDDGEDDDGDGLVDLDDPACHGPDTFAEVSDCADGFDNDFDGLVDLDDPGCRGTQDNHIEDPECNDGIDNDGDTFVDYPADEDCLDPGDPKEAESSGSGSGGCGLLGIEAALLAVWLRRQRRRALVHSPPVFRDAAP